jgi:hypothetical protein
MLSLLVDYATVIYYIAFSADLLFQIIRVYRRKSSLDISWKGTFVRTIGSSVIFIKFLTVGDRSLIVGQSVFLIAVFVYLILVIYYRKPKNK